MLWRNRSGYTTPFSLRLDRLLSDTWLWEISSVILSTLFFASIIIVLGIYNQKEVPQFAYGLTLNAIISTLATFAKSSLLVAVAGSITQLKWHWYRSSEGNRLFDMQLFDDASRGPLGAIRILAGVSRWSLVSVGAIVFVLIPAFDPFIQQIISYSTQSVISKITSSQPSNTVRAENFIAQQEAKALYVDSDDIQQIVVRSLWDFSSDSPGLPKIHCPTGNCLWPEFESLGLCTSCEERARGFPSECPLSWNASEVQEAMTLRGDLSFPLNRTCTLELPGDLFCYAKNEFTIYAESTSVAYPKHIFGSDIILRSGEDVSNGTEYPKFLIPPAESWGLLSICDLEIQQKNVRGIASLSVKQATVCRLTPCIETYSLAITNSTPTFSVLDKRYGSWSFDATGLRYKDGNLYNTTSGLPFMETLGPSWSHMTGQNGRYFNLENTTSSYNFSSPYSIKYDDVYPLSNLKEPLYGSVLVRDIFIDDKRNWYSKSSGLQFKEEYFSGTSYFGLGGTENLNLRQITKIGGLAQALPRIASRISKYIREKDGIAVPGHSFGLVIHVNVRWEWLSLPAAIWAIGVIFFFATIRVCRNDKQMLWKGSSLPLFYHGLDNEDRQVIEVLASKKDRVSAMESASKEVHVRFPSDGNSPQLRLARRTDELSDTEVDSLQCFS